MENNNYVSVGNIIEQERLKRQAQIAKGVDSDVYDHIEKACSDDLSQSFEKSENLERFERDIQSLNKAETDLLLHKIQRQMNADSDSTLLKAMKIIAIQHANDLEKATYVDNPQNRKLGRVGQQYGNKKENEAAAKRKRYTRHGIDPRTGKRMTEEQAMNYDGPMRKFTSFDSYKKENPIEGVDFIWVDKDGKELKDFHAKKAQENDIEKAHQNDLSKGVEVTDNLSRFADDVDNLNKAETEFLLSKLQRQIVADPESSILKSFRSIAINHLNEIKKAHQDGEMHPNGKWVWVASANGGKGDWRTANGRAHKKHQETNSKKDGEGEKKTIDDHASGASTDALKRAADDKNAKPEVRESTKKELEKRNGGTKQKKNDKASSSIIVGNKVDIAKIPDAEFKRITQMLEKKNPDHRDAERYLEEEAMSDKELKNFHAVAEHFKNSSKINKLTQEYCRKWAELAIQEMQSRKKNR